MALVEQSQGTSLETIGVLVPGLSDSRPWIELGSDVL
jgi:hypothetical protein